MRKKNRRRGLRRYAQGCHAGRRADEAVHQHGQALRCRTQQQSGHKREFKAAQGRQGVYSVAFVQQPGIGREGLVQHGRLVAHHCGVGPRAWPGHGFRRQVQQGAGQGCARRGIGYTHLAQTQAAVAPGRQFAGQGHAPAQALQAGLPAHGRPPAHVRSAVAQAAVQQQGVGGKGPAGAARVHHVKVHAGGRAQGIDRGPAAQKIVDHLPGHVLRKRRNFLGRHAVVSGYGEHDRRGNAQGPFAPQSIEATGQFLQSAQAALGLGEGIQPGLRFAAAGFQQQGGVCGQRQAGVDGLEQCGSHGVLCSLSPGGAQEACGSGGIGRDAWPR